MGLTTKHRVRFSSYITMEVKTVSVNRIIITKLKIFYIFLFIKLTGSDFNQFFFPHI